MADTRIDELRRRLERDPGSRLFAQLAEELRKAGELAEAIRVARAGLALHPAYPSARLTLGRALLDSGDATGARVELESALRDAPDNILASRLIGQAREELGDLNGAAEQYRKTLVMAPADRQLQAALAAVAARIGAPAGAGTSGAPEKMPEATRRAAPPLPHASPTSGAPVTPARGTAATPPPITAAQPAAPHAGPGVFAAPSRPAAPAVPDAGEAGGEDGELPATLRIRSSQSLFAPAPPQPRRPEPSGPSAPQVPGAAAQSAEREARDAPTLPGGGGASLAEPAEAPPPGAAPSESTTPFSSSTLAELYFQQGLVDRAKDVYRQLLEQDPVNEKARSRLAELEQAAPALGTEERAVRRRSLERTIAGLETLLAAVRRR